MTVVKLVKTAVRRFLGSGGYGADVGVKIKGDVHKASTTNTRIAFGDKQQQTDKPLSTNHIAARSATLGLIQSTRQAQHISALIPSKQTAYASTRKQGYRYQKYYNHNHITERDNQESGWFTTQLSGRLSCHSSTQIHGTLSGTVGAQTMRFDVSIRQLDSTKRQLDPLLSWLGTPSI
ncbi:hypothetical protein BJ165DRAFT_1592898 [Panaeolus papilionaceus]|nr:hypothetical protein BJ165DRAFT_1592898 [Panaeolus papilionaceus]